MTAKEYAQRELDEADGAHHAADSESIKVLARMVLAVCEQREAALSGSGASLGDAVSRMDAIAKGSSRG